MGKDYTGPLYVLEDPETYAEAFKQKLIALGCSEEYAERARKDTLKRAVQVASSYEANMRASGRAG